MFRSIAITLTLCLATATAQASLLGRAALTPGGTDYQAYYDDVLDITWMADANLAATNDFGVAGIYADGRMNWFTAQSWIGAMNAANFLGTSTWRLPIIDTGFSGCHYAYTGTNCGFNVDLGSEMAHMYHSTLGNVSYYDTSGSPTSCGGGTISCLTNTGPFSNLRRSSYWSGTTYAGSWAWYFIIGDGYQMNDGGKEGSVFRAWAVSDGDMLAPVPVPGAMWLFGSALGVMGWMRSKMAV
jgi:hypothetical protein